MLVTVTPGVKKKIFVYIFCCTGWIWKVLEWFVFVRRLRSKATVVNLNFYHVTYYVRWPHTCACCCSCIGSLFLTLYLSIFPNNACNQNWFFCHYKKFFTTPLGVLHVFMEYLQRSCNSLYRAKYECQI